jgi:tetratricopeptide (TPR) repeat protein
VLRLLLYPWHVARELAESWPGRLLLLILALALVLLASVGGAFAMRIRKGQHDRLVAAAWHRADECLAHGDFEGVRAQLHALHELAPRDPRIERRLAMMDTGEADADDGPMLRLLMREHARRGRTDDAAREAAKLVALYPAVWEPRLLLIHLALQKGDRATAAAQLEKLPPAQQARDGVYPGTALLGLRLFEELQRPDRTRDLLEYVAQVLMPLMRGARSELLTAPEKLQLLACYQQALQGLGLPRELVGYWVPAQRLARSVLHADATEVAHLVDLGRLQEGSLPLLAALQRERLIDADTATNLTREAENQIRAVWDRVRQRDAKCSWGYVGQAVALLRDDKAEDALKVLDEGLEACGSEPELVAAKGQVLRLRDPQAGLAFLEQSVQPDRATQHLWRLFAESSLAAGRLDRALAACRQALRDQPDLAWACRLEAEILLELQRPTEAAASLERIRPTLAQDPACAALYVRSLGAAGAVPLAIDFVQDLQREQRAPGVLLPAAAALLTAGQAEEAARAARHVLDREPLNRGAHVVLGDCLRVQAQHPETGWDVDLVRKALREYELAQQSDHDNLVVAERVARLQLMALNLPDLAYRTAEPLRQAESSGQLTPAMLETLGATYLAAGKFEAARRPLERSAAAQPRAAVFCLLAHAYLGLGRTADARRCAARAGELPKSPREAADLVQLVRRIEGTP